MKSLFKITKKVFFLHLNFFSLILFSLGTVLVFLAYLLYLNHLAFSIPVWYKDLECQTDSISKLSEDVEYRFTEEIYKVRTSQNWILQIPIDAINAWIACRLEDWIRHESEITWPERLRAPYIESRDGRVQIAFHIKDDFFKIKKDFFVIFVLKLEVINEKILIDIESLRSGRMPFGLNTEWLITKFDDFIKSNYFQKLLNGFLLSNIFELADGRVVKCTKIETKNGYFEAHLVTKLPIN